MGQVRGFYRRIDMKNIEKIDQALDLITSINTSGLTEEATGNVIYEINDAAISLESVKDDLLEKTNYVEFV
jgi:hypothetical protein